jgi:NADPH:quinone reductase
MKAIQIAQPGGPEVLQIREIPTPTISETEVLIRVAASGINFIDIFVREGRYATPCPFVPGQEAAGTIVAVGSEVSDLKVGERVAWCSVLGTYAEYAVAPAGRVIPIPSELSFEQAAACLLQGMAAHYLTHSASPIHKGDPVLVHAGAGGTGLLLIQMAKSLGATVFTTVSTEDKALLARQAGADEVILYTKSAFALEVKELTKGQGLATVYDSIGKTTFEQSLACLRPRGTLVIYGSASGDIPPFDLDRLAQLGSLHVTRPILKHYTLTREELVGRATDVFQAILSGRLTLRIGETLPLAEAAHAQQKLASRATAGKLLLIP